jgi:hypothetical protein
MVQQVAPYTQMLWLWHDGKPFVGRTSRRRNQHKKVLRTNSLNRTIKHFLTRHWTGQGDYFGAPIRISYGEVARYSWAQARRSVCRSQELGFIIHPHHFKSFYTMLWLNAFIYAIKMFLQVLASPVEQIVIDSTPHAEFFTRSTEHSARMEGIDSLEKIPLV